MPTLLDEGSIPLGVYNNFFKKLKLVEIHKLQIFGLINLLDISTFLDSS